MARRGFATYMEYERGFRGWLVFFFVTSCLAALFRIYILFQTSRTLYFFGGSGEAPLITAVVVQLLIDGVLFLALIVGLKLFADQNPRTPRYWSAFFLVAVVLEFTNFALIAYQLTYFEKESFSSQLWSTLRDGGARGLVLSLIWALYWIRSKRVKLTYGTRGFDPIPDAAAISSPNVT